MIDFLKMTWVDVFVAEKVIKNLNCNITGLADIFDEVNYVADTWNSQQHISLELWSKYVQTRMDHIQWRPVSQLYELSKVIELASNNFYKNAFNHSIL